MNDSEIKFKEWLEHKQYPYLYIEQSTDTFFTLFKDITKRPDFIVVLPSIGLIAVDVKHRTLDEKFENFILDEKEEIMRFSSFERIFRIPIWFAISNNGSSYRIWNWISLAEIQEKIQIKESSKSGDSFRPIRIIDTITVGYNDGLDKLFKV